jgi:hypothetical protein
VPLADEQSIYFDRLVLNDIALDLKVRENIDRGVGDEQRFSTPIRSPNSNLDQPLKSCCNCGRAMATLLTWRDAIMPARMSTVTALHLVSLFQPLPKPFPTV